MAKSNRQMLTASGVVLLAAAVLCPWASTVAAEGASAMIRIEGAWPKFHNWTAVTKMAYGDGLELRELLGVADAAGYRAGYEFTVPVAGRYRLWLVGTPPGPGWVSPLQLTLNGRKLKIEETESLGRHPKHPLSYWRPLCEVDLPAGSNNLIALVIQRRRFPDKEFCFYIDEFLLTPLDWKLPADKAPVLPRPANVKTDSTTRSFCVDAAQAGSAFPPAPYALCQGSGPSAWSPGFVDTILPDLKRLKPKFFRKDNFTPKCVKVEGKWQYDFTELDRIVDDIRAMGAEVIPCLEAAGPAVDAIPAGKVLNLSGWEEYWYEVVKHFNVDRKLGIRYWEVFNEPDGRAWYKDHYVELFRYAQRGARRADPTALVGGPASIGPYEAIPFVQKCLAAGVKPGFVSYHVYGVPGDEFVDMAESIRGEARKLTGNPELPLLITEWGITSTCCKYWWNSLAPAFNVSVYTAMARRSGCPDVATQFMVKDNSPGARYGMFTIDDRARPSFFAAQLFWTMSGTIVPLTGDRSETLDGLATRDGRDLRIIFWSMEREGAPRRVVDLKIRGLPLTHYRGRRAVIDPYCTNPYNRRHANPESRDMIWTRWEQVDAVKGTVVLKFEMAPPGVTLVQVAARGNGR